MRACVHMHVCAERSGGIDLGPGMIMGRDAVSLGRVAPIVSFLLFGSVTSPAEGQGRQVRRGRKRIPWSEWAFTGTLVPQTPRVHTGLGGPLGGALV